MSKIAMFGGSFNPVHTGHTGLVARMLDTFNLDKVYVIPTFSTPLKDNTPMLSPKHRLEMCKLAFAQEDKVCVSDIEIVREGRSYTFLTLQELSHTHPESELFLIIGADSFVQLPQWYNVKEIFSLAGILTVSRGEYGYSFLNELKEKYEKEYNANVKIIEEPIAPVSSTIIRNAIKSKEDIRRYLPKDVFEYIRQNRLYDYED